MYSTLFATTLVFALAVLCVRADFDVATVELTQCKPAILAWPNTNGPYNVIIVSFDNPCGDALVDFGDQNTNTYQWSKVNLPAGSKVQVSILDANDLEGWSGPITVKSSDDSSCLPSKGTPASSSVSKPPTPPSSATSHSPSATIVGAANAGLMSGGASMLHFSGAAVAAAVLGALAALL
ncbi:hypothetical protein BDM02DRAFT_3129388 [Thelephora ganbajun]|uniref:Uncharacterized protein n=1 Tax=Thelephora ganbajun TaxID=370292 RepID=A0ACB6ZEB8_THEGA|nr:hypothetical protein BDM02DRAFT_3129388 [Thelephora ganbajun]